MKKVLGLLALTSLAFTGCSKEKDEVVSNIEKRVVESKKKEKEEKELPKGNDIGDGEKNVVERNDVEEKKEVETLPSDLVELAKEDITAYFQIDACTQSVWQAIANVEKKKGVREESKLQISEAAVLDRNDEAGSFTLKVVGSFAGQPFDKTFKLEGLIQKPNSYNLVKRLNFMLDKDKETAFQNNFDFGAWYINGDKAKYTPEYLSQWGKFYATTPGDFNIYWLSKEDLHSLHVKNVDYDVSLGFTFSSVNGSANTSDRVSFKFSKESYFKKIIKVNTKNLSQWYITSVAGNIEIFLPGMLEYDSEHIYVVKSAESLPNLNIEGNGVGNLNLTLVVRRKTTDEELATIVMNFTGFKPFSDLPKDVMVYSSYDLNDFFSKKLGKFSQLKTGTDVSRLINRSVASWIKYVKFSGKNGKVDLPFDTQDGRPVLGFLSGGITELNYHFVDPKFEVISAIYNGREVEMKLKMSFVDDAYVEDCEWNFNIFIHKNPS